MCRNQTIMKTSHSQIGRRGFLRGLGTLIALPAMESLAPFGKAAGKPGAGPLRMAYIYSPNGKNMDKWRPEGFGTDYKMSETLAPLSGLRDQFQILSGLDHDKAHANGDGGGDHARANATFLTGVQIKKTAGADIKAGVSVDQIAAAQLGHETFLPSMELSCDRARMSGGCDSGYACAYQYNVSWKSENQPMTPESDPRQVFERMFGAKDTKISKEARERRAAQKKSILDFVLDDAKSLQGKLGVNDRRKLDEYMSAVREMEVRIEHAEAHAKKLPDMEAPSGVPGSYKEHIRLLYDLMAVAFETDTTRISTFMMAHDGSNRNFDEVGVREGHHELSHHQRNADKMEKIAKIDKFYVEQFAYFLEKMKNAKDASGASLLDSSMIVYGCGLSDGDRHNHDDLPIILAGGGNGQLRRGRHVNFSGDVPLTNLYLSLLDRMNVKAERIGDSNGRVAEI